LQIVAATEESVALQQAIDAGDHPLEYAPPLYPFIFPPNNACGCCRCAACQFTLDKLQELLENSTALDQKVEDFLQNDFCTLLPKDAQASLPPFSKTTEYRF
jgi:hypothetical protein